MKIINFDKIGKAKVNDIKEFFSGCDLETARLGQNKVIDKDFRSTKILKTKDKEISDLLFSYALEASEIYGIELADEMPEVQYAEYREGDHYKFHSDVISRQNPRTITIVILLDDDFEGGEFQFKGMKNSNLVSGSVMAFPSHFVHRVKPVSKGLRRSLVMWVNRKIANIA